MTLVLGRSLSCCNRVPGAIVRIGMQGTEQHQAPAEGEPASTAAYELVNEAGSRPLLLVCDHASNTMPSDFGNLGLDHADLSRHIAWDIGAAEVTRDLARRLNAPAILSRFSRLLIDPNRSFDDPTLIPQISDGVVIPGNRDLSEPQRTERIQRFHRPYHDAVSALIDRLLERQSSLDIISVHSFTPIIKGYERPWEIGILWNRDPRLPEPMIAHLRALGLTVGDNEPYSGRDGHGYTQHRHADDRGLANALVELRQDLVDTHHGALAWAERLAKVLEEILPGYSGQPIHNHIESVQ